MQVTDFLQNGTEFTYMYTHVYKPGLIHKTKLNIQLQEELQPIALALASAKNQLHAQTEQGQTQGV